MRKIFPLVSLGVISSVVAPAIVNTSKVEASTPANSLDQHVNISSIESSQQFTPIDKKVPILYNQRKKFIPDDDLEKTAYVFAATGFLVLTTRLLARVLGVSGDFERKKD